MKHLFSGTAIAAALVFGGLGPAGAQAVDPSQPGSASGGLQAQATQPGQHQMGQASQGSGAQTPATPGSPGAATGASRMSEDQIRTTLRARGYSDISGLERDGDAFKVREAERYGEKIENLRVDANTGQVRDERRLSEDQVRNMLREQGYSEIRDVSRDGNTVTARAKRGDTEVRLRVDANTGAVSQQQASN
jgi:hypothetical protein